MSLTLAPSCHRSVMPAEMLAHLAPVSGGTYVDGTFGGGGWSRAILQSTDTKVIGIDRDPQALARAQEWADAFAGRLTLVSGRFGQMGQVLREMGVTQVDGVTLDLGLSSDQLDEAARGFSFQKDGPLDMRMEGPEGEGASAADLVNTMPEAELVALIAELGEERGAGRIVRAIVQARQEHPLTRTHELADLIRKALGPVGQAQAARTGTDPATRTFQALRMAANDELGEVERGLAAAEQILRPGGRLVVVAFHSLEDRCVKNFLRQGSSRAPAPSRHQPAAAAVCARWQVLTSRAVTPSPEEIAANPRSRSAKLRAAIRLDSPCLSQRRSAA
ncbi:MAG: 16S rRNA (cytosine(1402)-N(4))-methyltransferase RsmH [Alphaproteobacteria bacterium]|nr:MAG: 16S rRNA (cytosine(1402)-N(4))-methyltransferase RsmH [Alphaproteobacteria bacterium]